MDPPQSAQASPVISLAARLLRAPGFWIGLAAAVAAGAAHGQSLSLSAEDRARCIAEGGRVAIAGLLGGEVCARPFRDAGRRCRDSDDCEGACLFDARSAAGRSPRPGTRVAGRCEPERYGFGCRTLVEDGRLQPTLCVD
jgi:hypothetical protein